jgi:proteasome lid subunit RPN8/RPN11
MLSIRESDLRSIIDHCIEEFPSEACGILAGKDGAVEKVYRMTNVRPGPVSFEMEPQEQFRVMEEIRGSGRSLLGIYHSHPSGPAYPSSMDVEQAYWPGTLFPSYPEAVHVIVSLRDRQRPVVAGYAISDGKVSEVALLHGERGMV